MRALRDTFLHFLADNLSGTKIHPLRRDKNDASLSAPQVNAVNVQFIKDSLGVSVAQTTVSIDILNDDENNCLDTVQAVWNILATVGSIPKLDYSGQSPVATGTSISWNTGNVQFRYVYSDFYYRYSCLLSLTHHPTFEAPQSSSPSTTGYGQSSYGTSPYGS